MAEGLARQMAGSKWEASSAGIEPKGVNPYTMRAMHEVGIDISGHTSKPMDPDLLTRMDLIVTLCGDARDRCPITPPRVRHLHWPIADPAAVRGTDEEIMRAFRDTREEIARRVRELLGTYGNTSLQDEPLR